MKDHISKAEIRKDAIQEGVEATTQAVGQVASIVVNAVGDVAKTVGGLATDFFEIRAAARSAQADAGAAIEEEPAAEPLSTDRPQD